MKNFKQISTTTNFKQISTITIISQSTTKTTRGCWRRQEMRPECWRMLSRNWRSRSIFTSRRCLKLKNSPGSKNPFLRRRFPAWRRNYLKTKIIRSIITTTRKQEQKTSFLLSPSRLVSPLSPTSFLKNDGEYYFIFGFKGVAHWTCLIINWDYCRDSSYFHSVNLLKTTGFYTTFLVPGFNLQMMWLKHKDWGKERGKV